MPPQTKFNPNVFNVNQPTEQILGVFSVYSARRMVLNINMQQNIDGVQQKTVIDFRPFTPNPLASAPSRSRKGGRIRVYSAYKSPRSTTKN